MYQSDIQLSSPMTLDAVLMMRFPRNVKAALARAAKAERRSMSNLVLAVLGEYLAERGYLEDAEPRRKVRARRTGRGRMQP